MPNRREDVRVILRGREYSGWFDLEVQRHLDSYSTLSFSAPFEPERGTFREDFRPFSYHPLSVSVGGAPLFTGTLIDAPPSTEPGSRTVGVSAYARPGVLADVNMPTSSWPLEYNRLTLTQIAERVCEPFGIGVLVDAPVGAAFARVAMDPDAQPQTFLADLARQRGCILADAPDGRLWIRQSAPASAAAVTRFTEGVPPLVSASVSFNAREYYSDVTGVGAARAGRRGSAYTARNTHLADVTRPLVYKPEDTETGDVPATSRARLGRMFGNAATYEISLPTWRDPRGALWAPNAVVELEAPGAMVYRPTRMIVRTVTLRLTANEQSSKLALVLPGAFSGEIPEVLPWD